MAITAEHLGRCAPPVARPSLRLVPSSATAARGRPARPAARPVRAVRVSPAVYRRRRLAVAVAVVIALAAAATFGTLRAGDATAAEPVAVRTVVVAPGDTVWDLARRHAPDGTATADYAALIVRANDVDATAIAPGTVLVLPTR